MEEPRTAAGFLCITDINGFRHALRLNSISAVRDADQDRTEAMISFNGGRDTVIVPFDMDQVLAELSAPQPPAFGRPNQGLR